MSVGEAILQHVGVSLQIQEKYQALCIIDSVPVFVTPQVYCSSGMRMLKYEAKMLLNSPFNNLICSVDDRIIANVVDLYKSLGSQQILLPLFVIELFCFYFIFSGFLRKIVKDCYLEGNTLC